MCFKTYPLAVDPYRSGELEEPESWRDEFFVSFQRNVYWVDIESVCRFYERQKQNVLKN